MWRKLSCTNPRVFILRQVRSNQDHSLITNFTKIILKEHPGEIVLADGYKWWSKMKNLISGGSPLIKNSCDWHARSSILKSKDWFSTFGSPVICSVFTVVQLKLHFLDTASIYRLMQNFAGFKNCHNLQWRYQGARGIFQPQWKSSKQQYQHLALYWGVPGSPLRKLYCTSPITTP